MRHPLQSNVIQNRAIGVFINCAEIFIAHKYFFLISQKKIEGKKSIGIIRELQQHPTKDTIQHVDFYELDPAKPVRVKLPVRLTGASRGVLAGGRLMQVYRLMSCIGLPGALPDAIVLDIAPLKIGDSIRVGSIAIPGVELLDPANAVVVSVKMARGAVKPTETDDEEEEA